MNSRYRKGWFGESQRHYLASKGIKTKRYFIWKYKDKQYPDVVSVSEKYSSKNRLKPFTTVRRINAKMLDKEKRHAASFLDTAEEVSPGTTQFLVDNKVAIETGKKTTEDMRLGVGAVRAGGYASLYDRNDDRIKGVIILGDTKNFPKNRQDLKEDVLTFHHEVGHAKRDAGMRKKGLEPFADVDGWETKPTKTVSYNDRGEKRTTFSADITPIADFEIEAEHYKGRVDKKLSREGTDVDSIYDKKFTGEDDEQ